MPDAATLLAVTLTFLLAGAVKGVVGLGLPSIALALLTATQGLHSAMALLIMPSLVTNVWQALSGGYGRRTLARVWPFLLAATLTVWVGALALRRIDVAWLSGLLGVLLAAYALFALMRAAVRIPPATERWAGPLLGGINGVLTGMTGAFAFPGVLYLQGLGLPRDQLVQAMGMLFTASTLALALALGGQQLLGWDTGLLSTGAVLPALLGMALGRRLRHRLPEPVFRRVFFVALLGLGLYILVQTVL